MQEITKTKSLASPNNMVNSEYTNLQDADKSVGRWRFSQRAAFRADHMCWF